MNRTFLWNATQRSEPLKYGNNAQNLINYHKMKKMITLAVLFVISMATVKAQTLLSEPTDEILLEQMLTEYYESDTTKVSWFESVNDVSFPMESSMVEYKNIQGCAPSQVAAGLCSIFLGGLGVGNFIVGRVGRGVLDILFCWTGIPEIVGIIRGIYWLAMTPEKWEAKFGCPGQQTIIINTTNTNAMSTGGSE